MKRVTIIGSTGSIGVQALSVIEKYRERFVIDALAANRNVDLLYKQIKRFNPQRVVLYDREAALRLDHLLKGIKRPEILFGEEGIARISSDKNTDIILVAVTGIGGLKSVITALRNGLNVALANKESLVSGGRFVIQELNRSKGRIIPVDSEHSAIFQLISGTRRELISKVILTATGGPFRGKGPGEIRDVGVEDVLKHPRWRMGKKVTVDSATMVNKAFEMIEARWLFGLDSDKIEVVIHPQALVHSLLQLKDGSYIAHIGPADMRIPIAYALSYPDRLENVASGKRLDELEGITFEKVRPPFDHPLRLAKRIMDGDEDYGIVFNAADEVAVEYFLKRRISFGDIMKIIDYSMKHFKPSGIKDISDVIEFDMEIKRHLARYIEKRL